MVVGRCRATAFGCPKRGAQTKSQTSAPPVGVSPKFAYDVQVLRVALAHGCEREVHVRDELRCLKWSCT